MTGGEARRLLLYSVVYWDGDRTDLGTVTELGNNGFFVRWANGKEGWIDYKDAAKVSLY